MIRFRTVAIEPSVGVGLQRPRIYQETANSLLLLKVRVDSEGSLFAFSKPLKINTESQEHIVSKNITD